MGKIPGNAETHDRKSGISGESAPIPVSGALAEAFGISHLSAMQMRNLTRAALFVLAVFAGQSAYAQDAPDMWQPPMQSDEAPRNTLPDDGATEDGNRDPIERGMGSFLENLLRDMGPELDQFGQDMSGAFENLTPMLRDLRMQIDDLRNYQAPERLENGDIIIRRKADAPPPPPMGEKDPDIPDRKPAPGMPVDPDAPEFEL